MARLLNLFCFKRIENECATQVAAAIEQLAIPKHMTPSQTFGLEQHHLPDAHFFWKNSIWTLVSPIGWWCIENVGWILHATQMQVMMADMTCTLVGALFWEFIEFQMESHCKINNSLYNATISKFKCHQAQPCFHIPPPRNSNGTRPCVTSHYTRGL